MTNITNYDEIVDEFFNSKNKKNKNPWFMPQHPFRLIIVGGSGCGKTNLLLNMLLKWLRYDNLYLISKSLNQDKYLFLIKFMEDAEKELRIKEDNDNFKFFYYGDKLEDIPDIDSLDPSLDHLIVIDDFLMESKSDKIKDLFSRCRHKNISVIFISQSYYEIDKTVRLNASHYIIFDVNNKREVSALSQDVGKNLTNIQFKKLFFNSVSDNYSFLFVDKDKKYIPQIYRKGLYDFWFDINF